MRYLVFIFLALLSVLTFSCNINKKYYYQENSKDEKEILASSDSAAYLEAYQNFQISKKVYNNMKESLGSTYITEPLSFTLYNEKHEDITYKVTFENYEQLKKEIENRILGLKNSLGESIQKSREEKHGAGAKYDTGGLYLAPVKVLSARFTKKEYSTYKDISLTFKNVSSKVVSGIRFKWYGENAFNEPADMSGIIDGWGTGFTDDELKPGKTDSGTWGVLSKDGKKVLIAYPYEVAFKDGTKWKLEYQ